MDRQTYRDVDEWTWVCGRTDGYRYTDRQTDRYMDRQTEAHGHKASYRRVGTTQACTDRRTDADTDSAPCSLGISAGLPGKARLAATGIAQEAPKMSLFRGNFTTCRGPRLSFGVFPHAVTADPTGTLW